MAGKEAIKFLRGTSTKRLASTATLSAGQPFYETDTNKLYIGEDNALNSAVPIVATPDTHCHTYLTDTDQCGIYIDDGASIEFTYNDVHQGTDMSTRNWYIHYGGTASFSSLSSDNCTISGELDVGYLSVNGNTVSPMYRTVITCYSSDQAEDDSLWDYKILIDKNIYCSNSDAVKNNLLSIYTSQDVLLPCYVFPKDSVIATPIAVTVRNYTITVHCADGTEYVYFAYGQGEDGRWIFEICYCI